MKIYLDIDGVCLPLRAMDSGFCPDTWPDWTKGHLNIIWSKMMADELDAIAGESGAEIVWVTTWQDEANYAVSRWFGWKPRRVLRPPSRAGWWKSEAVTVDLAPGERFVWCDDEIDKQRSEFSAAASRLTRPSNQNALLVAPDRNVGLTRGHLAEIRRFCVVGPSLHTAERPKSHSSRRACPRS